VETLRQMDVLHRAGCALMQGFLFSRAVPPEELQRWLQNTVLPRKAPWIGAAADLGSSAETSGPPGLSRAAGGRQKR
jgi:hypothetical protein